MHRPLFYVALASILALSTVMPSVAQSPAASEAITQAVANPARTEANRARDKYRHPAETLAFFGVKPDQTIVEIWSAGGWYTEILAPLTKSRGTLYSTGPWPNGVKGIQTKQTADAATYGHVKLAAFPVVAADAPRVPDGSADVVLTFRNVHNWKMGYQGDGKDYSAEAFRQMYAMLKPGGVLGVVDHRLPEAASAEREKNSGYLKVSTVKKLATDAGFQLAGESEINANPKDTADWKDGVWTLPPGLRLKDVDREKYLAIGESDRMTLKFVKPK